VNGTGSVKVSGTEATGDTVSITFSGKLFASSVVVSVTSVSGDSDQTIAEKLGAAINANSTLEGFGVEASTDSGTAGQVDVVWPGPLGSFVTMTPHTTGAETFTTTQISGGSGPIIPSDNFQFMNNGGIVRLWKGRRVTLDSPTLTTLVNGGPNSFTGVFPCQ
jgi:phage tail sheath gpL-like